MKIFIDGNDWLRRMIMIGYPVYLMSHFVFKLSTYFKGAGPHNVNNLLWKRRVCSIFDSPYHRDFPLLISKYRCNFEDGLFNFVEKETKHSDVVGLQRY